MQIYSVFLILVGVPLLGSLVSIALSLSARKQKDMESEDWKSADADRGAESAKLLVLLAVSGTKPLYGFVQAFLLLVHTGALSGVPDALAMYGDKAVVYCMVGAAMNLIAVLADGFLTAGVIRKDALTVPSRFSRAVLILMLPELIAISGLLYCNLTLVMR